MKFNQPLNVPSFIQAINDGNKSRRILATASIEEVDVNEFMAFSMVKNDDGKPSEAQFSVILKKWDENGMKLKIDFGNPLAVSQG